MFRSSLPAAAAALIVIAGCGSTSSVSTTAQGSSAAQFQQQLVRFSDCMRTHGVPAFPDPQDGGSVKFALSPDSPYARSPGFQSAYSSCRRLAPGGGSSAAGEGHGPAQVADFVAFASCMRSHGFRRFPDPTSTGQLTHEMLASAGIDLHQPSVLHAADACTGVTHGAITPAMVARFVAGQ